MRYCAWHAPIHEQYRAVTVTELHCQNIHEPNRLASVEHSALENRWERYETVGGHRLTQRLRAAGEEVEVGRIGAHSSP